MTPGEVRRAKAQAREERILEPVFGIEPTTYGLQNRDIFPHRAKTWGKSWVLQDGEYA